MHRVIRELLEQDDGVVHRAAALPLVDRKVIDRELAAGRLARPYPRTYVSSPAVDDRTVLVRAALRYTEGHAALSHTSALAVWRLPTPQDGPIHLMTDEHHHFRSPRFRGVPSLKVHRREGFRLEPPEVVTRSGLPVTRLEQSIIDSWPLLDGHAKLAPAIQAVAGRRTTPGRLADALAGAPRLAGRRYLAELIRLLAAGCRSHLELWGYRKVFSGPGFAFLEWQVPIELNGRTIYLDALDPTTGVNLELDGARYHASALDRERDLRRDAGLAALGVTVIRITHDRLTREPGAVRRQVLAAMTARLGGWSAARLTAMTRRTRTARGANSP